MPHTPASLVEESNRLFQHAWTYFVRRMPAGATTRVPGLLIANGRSGLSFMNIAIPTSPVADEADLRARIGLAASHFRKDGVHWLMVISDDVLPGALRERLTNVCVDAGLQYALPMFGMVADVLLDPVRPLPALDMQVVTTAALREAVGDINAAGYAMPGELFRPVTTLPEFWTDMIGVVGIAKGIPVATASVALIDEVAYVALVATDPDHQRKGYAEAVMRRALEESAEAWGERRTVLHATAAGQPVYRRMGYADVVRFDAFAGV
ncbi:putative acetyltransferase involved in intracellular survival [Luteitalea pratensis]|uniref:Putative acetyltransferase involved in intracellular survival n=1 Tax=Luteitalea pratensis TaxID=1855912 RepID=A0A143PKJ4_LUTPR|nr:GNAT family N-acetyltransferase [Luteitalea pratensis]AMY08770.1 putative acetyltransferase involved in intracellular survival [Luteitalea pratensis]